VAPWPPTDHTTGLCLRGAGDAGRGGQTATEDHPGGLSPASQARAINAMKSLFSFAQRIGYLEFNPGAAIRSPKIKKTLAERILPEPQVHRLLALEPSTRNRVLLRLLYAAGGRVSEICGLKWRDVQSRGEAGQITLFGKGGKTRTILLSPDTWQELIAIRKDANPDTPVFISRKGQGHLNSSQVWRIVRAAAERAGIDVPVSPHWLRHAHASHALDRGAPIHLVQATLGHASVATTGFIYMLGRRIARQGISQCK
jgi:site-specific recombinase XerD